MQNLSYENEFDLHENESVCQGRSQDFSKGGGGVTVCQSEGTRQMVMSFSPPIVSCLLKKSSQNGGLKAPQDPPPSHWLRPCL